MVVIREDKIVKALNQVKFQKAIGRDGISTEMIKLGG